MDNFKNLRNLTDKKKPGDTSLGGKLSESKYPGNMNTVNDHHPLWAEIDLDAITHNLKAVRQLVESSSRIMSVVKADAYGHGALKIAHRISETGVDAFGVARLSEGIALRKSGLQQPILVFGYTPPGAAREIIENDLIQTVFSTSYAVSLNDHARAANGRIKTHLKIDTGMGRLGLVPAQLNGDYNNSETGKDSVLKSVTSISQLASLEIEGAYTHLASSDTIDKTSARKQLVLFQEVVSLLKANGIQIPVMHAANSGAIINLPESHLDVVRPGIMLYGLYPSAEVNSQKIELQPAMQLKARVAQVKNVSRGFTVSYAHTYTTPGATRLATVPVGYADGYNRQLSSSGVMLVRGQRAPVVGRVCMDQTIIDVGHIQGVRGGDEVVIIGKQGDAVLSADEMALQLGTINYEVVASLMARVPRVYLGS